MDNYYREYCSGCGICHSCGLSNMKEDNKGFLFPDHVNEEMEHFCDRICPMGKNGTSYVSDAGLWGDYKAFFEGYAKDTLIRKKASSGGVLTAICCWLLQEGKVDAIIQTTYSSFDPTDTITVISDNSDEVLNRAGSRYSRSSPLLCIDEIIDRAKKYAFVGKPCDVVALSNYMEEKTELKNNILYTFSFFCAGTPSQDANNKLLDTLGCVKDNCTELNYRGDGWPGYTKAVDNNGKEHMLDYQTAWMDILGRDIRFSCKFCMDSIGEKSDVSCGDFWFLTDEGSPDFSEHDGRNCIFAWSGKGKKLLDDIKLAGWLELKDSDINLLKFAQPNHSNRRATMLTKVLGLKLMKRRVPKYSINLLLHYAKFASLREHYRALKGTVRRIKRKSI